MVHRFCSAQLYLVAVHITGRNAALRGFHSPETLVLFGLQFRRRCHHQVSARKIPSGPQFVRAYCVHASLAVVSCWCVYGVCICPLQVRGRAQAIQCEGVCGRLRSTQYFGYR